MEGRVLVVQLARLGDLVQTWPLLRRLGHQEVGPAPDLLADQGLKPLHPLGPALHRVWDLDLAGLAALAARELPAAYDRLGGLLADFRSQRYQAVYNLNQSRISLLLASRIKSEVKGYRPVRGGRDFLRDPWLALVFALVHARRFNRLHLSDVFRHLAPPRADEPEPPVPAPKSGEPVIALQMGTRHPRRTWPAAAFVRLAELLVERLGAWIWLLGTRTEAPLGLRLVQELAPAYRERVVNLQGRTDLPELAARLLETHVLVSGDTGTLHLAAALGTRTLAVFLGPASCHETGPYGFGHYVLQTEPACHPCTEADNGCQKPRCLAMIPPEAAADLVVALVLQGEAAQAPPLPAGVRLYRSSMEALGACFVPVGSPLGFADLVGQAYRRAAARLIGLSLPGSIPRSWEGGEEDRQNLATLAAVLRNGAGQTATSPVVAAALTPLMAFQQEMARQQTLGKSLAQTEACLETVTAGFRDAIREFD
ncbi:MAG: glycosyltransferase family 9 protein [Desulfobaccales bacterium]